jgi:membrane protease subunit HflK
MALLYAVSGVTVIRPDEVGVVKRWGRLLSGSAATREHGPGLLFAFPPPIDEVVRVKTRYVRELSIQLAPPENAMGGARLDPLTVGYALSGDQNVVHVKLVARYRVRDPAAWAFHGPPSEEIVRTEVSAATIRSLGELSVDHVLAEGRKDLIQRVTQRTQAGLDAAHSGLELVALELTDLAPPRALVKEFEAVQTAYIGAETQKKEAQTYRQDVIPRAQAVADAGVQSARADAATNRARAQGDVKAFLALEREYRANPGVVRERLYRDAADRAIASAASVRWVPPPAGGRYAGLRVLVGPEPAQENTSGTTPRPSPAGEIP